MRILSLLVLLAFGLSACNTVAGAGRDIQEGGDVIADTAEEIRDEVY